VPEAIPDAAHPIAAAPAKEPMTALTVRLPESLAERLRVLAFRTRRGKGDLIVEALARFLDGAGA
jgi:predicted DNA-binding protein